MKHVIEDHIIELTKAVAGGVGVAGTAYAAAHQYAAAHFDLTQAKAIAECVATVMTALYSTVMVIIAGIKLVRTARGKE